MEAIRSIRTVLFEGWSDTKGKEYKPRPGVLIMYKSGTTTLYPLMSNADQIFKDTDSHVVLEADKYGLERDSWIAWGFEAKWDGMKYIDTLRQRVRLDLDTFFKARENYATSTNPKKMSGNPYAM